MDYRTDLAMERTVRPGGMGEGVSVHTQQQAGAEVTWVRVSSEKAAERLGKAQGLYWTLTHPKLPHMLPEERMDIAREVAQMLRMMLPPQGDVLVLGLGNRRMTADALGDRVVSGILVTRHMQEERLRSVCAVAPGVLGITGVETAELALGLAERVKPSAVIVVDALAAMETAHIGTTIQLTDTGIRPGSGVGNHRKGITAETMHVPVIAVRYPARRVRFDHRPRCAGGYDAARIRRRTGTCGAADQRLSARLRGYAAQHRRAGGGAGGLARAGNQQRAANESGDGRTVALPALTGIIGICAAYNPTMDERRWRT